MIQIFLSDKAYENEVYPLVKAFYPNEAVKVYGLPEALASENGALRPNGGQDQPQASEAVNIIRIDFKEDKFAIRLDRQNGESIVKTASAAALYTEKARYKNSFKRELYSVLSDITGRELPWGILTGIRPTKLVYDMLEKGRDDAYINRYMKDEYLCSEAKTSMSLKIAKRELKLLKDMDYRSGYSLYIGIPFCPSTCLYCSFPSYSIERMGNKVDEYLESLDKEIKYMASALPGKKLTTVYFGGGTPTTLTADQLDRLLCRVKESFDFTNVREFCVEAGRPDSITMDKLLVLKKWGVDRISINPQSMQQRTLDLIGRRHSIEQVRDAFGLARAAGFDNINMDLIIGLPGENLSDVTDTLSQIRTLEPDSLTVHTLALKRAARLNAEKEAYAGLKASDVPQMLDAAIKFTEDNGYLPYYLYRQKNMADNLENIGYSKYGKEGLYNILIMEEKQTILALGAGAMSKFVFHEENRIERVDNVKSITDYIGRIDEMIKRKMDFIVDNRDLL